MADMADRLEITDIDSLTYKEFIEGRTIYSSYRKALHKGMVAHHVVPVCLQDGKSRQSKDLDDRCLRLTYFEHIIAHYLLAKEYNTPELLYSFYCMVYTEKNKITDIESIKLETLKEASRIMTEALNLRSYNQKKLWESEERRASMSDLKRTQYIQNRDLTKSISKEFMIITPDGEKLYVENLRRWCRESNNFDNWSIASSHLSSPQRGYYQGIKYTENLEDNIDGYYAECIEGYSSDDIEYAKERLLQKLKSKKIDKLTHTSYALKKDGHYYILIKNMWEWGMSNGLSLEDVISVIKSRLWEGMYLEYVPIKSRRVVAQEIKKFFPSRIAEFEHNGEVIKVPVVRQWILETFGEKEYTDASNAFYRHFGTNEYKGYKYLGVKKITYV